LSVVVPTRNEAANVEALVSRLAEVLEGVVPDWEILFVDDSDDATPAVVTDLERRGLPVKLFHRPPGTRSGGLGGAVNDGFGVARGDVLVVMDADLQHPPEILPTLLAQVLDGEAELAAGSRYRWDGSAAGLSGPWRRVVSASCRRLVHMLVPRSRALEDPLSGLFAVRSSCLEGTRLRPSGYKILLEVAVRAAPSLVANVGFDFAPRHAGRSKASMRQGMVFLGHLARLVVVGLRPAGKKGARLSARPPDELVVGPVDRQVVGPVDRRIGRRRPPLEVPIDLRSEENCRRG
jgi:glycosyltransferase involved in cell wall biosynthesis